MVQGKAFPVGQILWAAQAFLQGLALGKGLGCSSRTPAGKQLCWCTAPAAALRSVLWAWSKGLGLDARRTPDFWAVEMFLREVAFSLLSLQLFLFSATKHFSSFWLKPFWKPSLNYMPFFHIQPPSLCRDAWSKLLLLDFSLWTHLWSDSSAIIKG